MAVAFDLIRPDDLLNLRVEGVNLRLNRRSRKNPHLAVQNRNKPAFLILTFPPQTITEPAFFEASIVPQDPTSGVPADPDAGSTSEPLNDPGQTVDDRTAVAKLGHPSRLVFKVEPDTKIPFTIAGLLDWSGLTLNVSPIAAIGRNPSSSEIQNAPAIREPEETETALELPYRLTISPTSDVTWNHRLDPFTHRGRTEMWHTRLQLRDGDGQPQELSAEETAPLRAIWSPDYDPFTPPDPVEEDPDLKRTAMAPNDRHQIVILTSAFSGYEVEKEFLFPIFTNVATNLGTLAANPALGEGSFELAQTPSRVALPKIGTYKKFVPYVPTPFEARQLMLSPLGGWLKSRGNWDPPRSVIPQVSSPIDPFNDLSDRFTSLDLLTRQPDLGRRLVRSRTGDDTPDLFFVPGLFPLKEQDILDLSEWVHIATQGRDHYVRIVYEGELWPTRHRAALVKITERKFKEHNGIVGAYLMQRMFIVVREPEKSFTSRALPFKKVRLTTLVTPDIADPDIFPTTKRSFWVNVMTSPTQEALFPFHAVGTDQGGEEIDFTIPMMFVSVSDLPVPANMNVVAKEYNAKDKIDLRQAVVGGKKVMFTPPHSDPTKASDNSQLVTETLNFVVDAAGNPPQLYKAGVKIPQVNELLGTDDSTIIRFAEDYVNNGIDAATGLFAEFVKEELGSYTPENPFGGVVADTLGATFSSDQAGGFATPNVAFSTLTRELGPLAGTAAQALTDSFDPLDFFGDGLAFLFGTFDLKDLLPSGSLGQNAPKLTTKTEEFPGGKKVIVSLDWEPPVKDVDLGIAEFLKDHGGTTDFKIEGLIEKPIKLDGSPAGEVTFDMDGKLTHFQVSVLNSVFVNFVEFGFESKSGQKTDVSVKLDPAKPIEFGGDLKFVEELRKAIPPDLFGDGPSLDISPTGIRAGFAFDLPPVAVGVFALKDVTLGAALTLPFLDGKPVFDFNVSERQQPFLLAVSIFGGGGFFRLQLDTAGMKMLEAALEFGVTCALDIGVASGEVHVMAGIYFSLQRVEENNDELAAVLSGYLRMGGSLSVLGLIKVSVEFNLSFTYDSATDKAYGRATLTVEVEVLFFSASVELTVERAFGGENGDPKFVEMYTTPETWEAYALAFA